MAPSAGDVATLRVDATPPAPPDASMSTNRVEVVQGNLDAYLETAVGPERLLTPTSRSGPAPC